MWRLRNDDWSSTAAIRNGQPPASTSACTATPVTTASSGSMPKFGALLQTPALSADASLGHQPKQSANNLSDTRHARRAADKHNLIDVGGCEASIFECCINRVDNGVEEWRVDALELGSCKLNTAAVKINSCRRRLTKYSNGPVLRSILIHVSGNVDSRSLASSISRNSRWRSPASSSDLPLCFSMCCKIDCWTRSGS